MLWNNEKTPDFGVLRGLKCVMVASALAGPFAFTLFADNGADVIWIENAHAYDPTRASKVLSCEVERRNFRYMTLDAFSEEGRKILFELLKDADVFLEASRGGTWAKQGITDEVLWEVNPRLVIGHESGFGQTGDPDYVHRPSYDPIAQAYSGYMYSDASGIDPTFMPYPTGPYGADFITGLYGAFGMLAALYRVRQTGIGESVDIAQFEVMARFCFYGPEMIKGAKPPRGADPGSVAASGTYKCMDGNYIYSFILAGAGNIRRTCEFFGIPYGGELVPKSKQVIFRDKPEDAELAKLFEEKWEDYISKHTAAEVEKEFLSRGITVSRVNSTADLAEDPHAIARETFVEYENMRGLRVKCVGPIPKYTRNPGKVWTPMMPAGWDNEDILGAIGYDEEAIKKLYDDRIITKGGLNTIMSEEEIQFR